MKPVAPERCPARESTAPVTLSGREEYAGFVETFIRRARHLGTVLFEDHTEWTGRFLLPRMERAYFPATLHSTPYLLFFFLGL
jgi:hypothetical protein